MYNSGAMKNYFAFIDESGVLDESKNIQPYFAVGLLKILDTSLIGEKLTQRHYDYFSVQKSKRKELLASLKSKPKKYQDSLWAAFFLVR